MYNLCHMIFALSQKHGFVKSLVTCFILVRPRVDPESWSTGCKHTHSKFCGNLKQPVYLLTMFLGSGKNPYAYEHERESEANVYSADSAVMQLHIHKTVGMNYF